MLGEFVRRALPVPFVEKGRDFSGWDCYGLVHCAYREIYGVELPAYLEYDSTREYEQLRSLIATAKPLWTPVKDCQVGDVALFTISGQPIHVALVVDRRNALHAESKLGTFLEPIRGVVWGKRLEGIYRYAGLSQNDGGDAPVQG